MKVLLINGSPNEKGCTYTALSEMVEVFHKEGIETEIFYIGVDAISPCRACRACTQLQKCVVDDKVNVLLEKIHQYDGFVIGSPVHYASASGVSGVRILGVNTSTADITSPASARCSARQMFSASGNSGIQISSPSIEPFQSISEKSFEIIFDVYPRVTMKRNAFSFFLR